MIRADCDSDGYIYLEDDVRSRYGDTFVMLETRDGLLLVPAPKDPKKAAAIVLSTVKR